jgi:spermidine synthase
VHGQQFKDPAQQNVPALYYSPEGGVGTFLRTHPRTANDGHLRIGVIGMGVASLASYARPGDLVRYYEIDPAVVRLSVGQHPVFTFLRHSLARIEIVLGDARLSLEREAAQGSFEHFDVLVVDAFNSDSIPVHLLTQEAVSLYLRHLRGPDSVLAFDISNNYLDLAPVLRGIADAHHLAITQVHRAGSNWILLSANPAMLQAPGLREVAAPPATDRPVLIWTDDYSNVFQVFRRSGL